MSKLTSDRKIVVFKGESLGPSTGLIKNKDGWNLEGVPINLFLNQLDEMIDSSGLRPLARPIFISKKIKLPRKRKKQFIKSKGSKVYQKLLDIKKISYGTYNHKFYGHPTKECW